MTTVRPTTSIFFNAFSASVSTAPFHANSLASFTSFHSADKSDAIEIDTNKENTVAADGRCN